MILVAAISTSILGVLWLTHEVAHYQDKVDRTRSDYMEARKNILKSQIDSIIDYITYKESQIEMRLKDEIKDRVNEAHAAATNIVNKFAKKLPRDTLEDLVRETLREIRFNDGHGYYFAFTMGGIETLFAEMPELEGANMLPTKDTNGRFVVPDMLDIAKNQGEGYYQYRWTKPGGTGNGYTKISFIKYFEPFDWVIGTATYTDDMSNTVKAEVLERIAGMQLLEDEYVFIGQWNGLVLAGPAVGEIMLDVEDVNGLKIVQELISLAKSNGGFLTYVMPDIDGQRVSTKISYTMGVPEWGWYVGSGVYIDEISRTIAEIREAERRQVVRTVIGSSGVLLLVLVIAVFIALRVTKSVREGVTAITGFFEQASVTPILTEAPKTRIPEFVQLAEAANRILVGRLRAEDAMRQSMQSSADIVRMMPAGLFIFEVENRNRVILVGANPEAERLAHITLEDWKGLEFDEIWPEAAQHNIKATFLTPLDTGQVYESDLVEFHGKYMEGFFRVRTFLMPEDRLGIAFEDVTAQKTAEDERRRFEEQVQHTQKLEGLGMLAGGIAHDFNNLLQAILGNAEMARQELPTDSPIGVNIQSIENTSLRAADLCQQLLSYSGQGAFKQELIDLSYLVKDMTQMLTVSISKKIRLEIVFSEEPVLVEADAGQMRQVVLNLITNAAEAIGDIPGTIRLTTMVGQVSDENLQLSRLAQIPAAGEYAQLSVTDTGQGMDEDTLEKMFDPFFTTKFAGRGLGLATVLGIIKRHDGAVLVSAAEQEGTSFAMLLPTAKGEQQLQEPDREEPDLPGPEATILVVDDESTVHAIAVKMLSRAGYKVLSAFNGKEALRVYIDHREEIHCVLMDLTMPEMDGMEASAAIREIDPDIPIVLASGFDEQNLVENYADYKINGFIQKPFRMAGLIEIITSVLDSHRN
jgi:signal transduction histidine kinase/nitrogen-specific signal transduction histidine kinase